MAGGWAPTGGGIWGEIFWNFQVKNAGFCAFLLRKAILVDRNRYQGASIDPLRAEDVKCKGVENLARGFNP